MRRTEEDLKGAMKHVQYEFNRLVLVGLYLSQHASVALGQGPNPEAVPMTPERWRDFARVMQDAWVESFVVHVRNLIDFFIGPSSRRPDDIVADDFFKDTATWWTGLDEAQKAHLSAQRIRAGKKLAHLTYHRLLDNDPWQVRDLIVRLAEFRDRFNSLGPAYRIEVDVKSLDEQPRRGDVPKTLADADPSVP